MMTFSSFIFYAEGTFFIAQQHFVHFLFLLPKAQVWVQNFI